MIRLVTEQGRPEPELWMNRQKVATHLPRPCPISRVGRIHEERFDSVWQACICFSAVEDYLIVRSLRFETVLLHHGAQVTRPPRAPDIPAAEHGSKVFGWVAPHLPRLGGVVHRGHVVLDTARDAGVADAWRVASDSSRVAIAWEPTQNFDCFRSNDNATQPSVRAGGSVRSVGACPPLVYDGGGDAVALPAAALIGFAGRARHFPGPSRLLVAVNHMDEDARVLESVASLYWVVETRIDPGGHSVEVLCGGGDPWRRCRG